jgi:hypothetical protein
MNRIQSTSFGNKDMKSAMFNVKFITKDIKNQ